MIEAILGWLMLAALDLVDWLFPVVYHVEIDDIYRVPGDPYVARRAK